MSLGLYHIVAPSEARLEVAYQLQCINEVGGARSALVWFRKKVMFSYFFPILFISIFVVGNIGTYHKLSSTYS